MYTLAIVVFMSPLWFVNSGNCIITEKINKRFLMLSLAFLANFFVCLLEWNWVLSNTHCGQGKA